LTKKANKSELHDRKVDGGLSLACFNFNGETKGLVYTVWTQGKNYIRATECPMLH
jgi:hypothetical protein